MCIRDRSKRGVTNVVGQTSRLYHVRVQAQPGGQFPPDLGNFERMGSRFLAKSRPCEGESTWVFAAKRRSAEECSRRPRSLAKSLREDE